MTTNTPKPSHIRRLQQKAQHVVKEVSEEAKNLYEVDDKAKFLADKAKSVAEKAKEAYEKAEIEEKAKNVADKVQEAYENSHIEDKVKNLFQAKPTDKAFSEEVDEEDDDLDDSLIIQVPPLDLHNGTLVGTPEVSFRDGAFEIKLVHSSRGTPSVIAPSINPRGMVNGVELATQVETTRYFRFPLSAFAAQKYDTENARVSVDKNDQITITSPVKEQVNNDVIDFFVSVPRDN